jgi:cobaltochelatase CobN
MAVPWKVVPPTEAALAVTVDYFQFHGGMVASIRALTGNQPKAYFGDSSRPDAAQVRDLREEALRVYRSRVINPKWIESIKRHG